MYELDISWAASAQELAGLRWQLVACDEVGGVFLTGREETLAVLYAGERAQFEQWARTLVLPATPATNRKGALR